MTLGTQRNRGGVDLCYVLWVVYADLTSSRVPFLDSVIDAVDASLGFGIALITAVTIVASLVHLTVIASGFLMLMLKVSGVYISLLQAPFRVFLAIPPTLFFGVFVETCG